MSYADCRRRRKTSGDTSVISIGDDIDSTFDQQLSASIPIEHSRKIYPDEHETELESKSLQLFRNSSSSAMPPTANDVSPNFSSVITRCNVLGEWIFGNERWWNNKISLAWTVHS